MNPPRIFLGAAFALLLSPHSEAQIVNGDFTAGLTGWTVNAVNAGFTPIDPSPFIHTTTVASDPAVKFETGAFSDGLNRARLSQAITVTPAAAMLVFDFTLPSVFPDATGTGGSTASDLFSAMIQPNGDLMTVDRSAAITTGPGFLGITVSPSPNPGYDRRLSADLSSYVGAPFTVTLIFEISQSDDGFRFDPFLDNVALTAIPEPAPFGTALALMAAGAAAFRKRCPRGASEKNC